MESIYFEKQEGSLCAQHCLNALLQGQYFTAVDLAKIAKDLDEEERMQMSESGVDSDEFRRFIQQPSQNMDDSGFFSVQVISRCLSIWGLELVAYGSSDVRAQQAMRSPMEERAFICNYKDHWFTIRRLSNRWFNLNSVNKGPTFISDTFLSLFLAQLQNEGYSIFVVVGALPPCEADDMVFLRETPLSSTGTTAPPSSPSHYSPLPNEDEVAMEAAEESEFQRALHLSLEARRDQQRNAMDAEDDDYDEDLRRAIQLSLSSAHSLPGASSSGACRRDVDICEGAAGGSMYMDMDAELEAAVRLSLECSDTSHTPHCS